MQVLRMLRSAISDCARVIRFGAKIQEPTRKQFVKTLQDICSRCDDTYSQLLKHLAPIKASLGQPDQLAKDIRAFASDPDVASLFKPERLCGEIDALLIRMESNLDPLKFALDITRIHSVRGELKMIGNYDDAIREQFTRFVSQLDELALKITTATGSDKTELADYAWNAIKDFEEELNSTVVEVRNTKTRIVN